MDKIKRFEAEMKDYTTEVQCDSAREIIRGMIEANEWNTKKELLYAGAVMSKLRQRYNQLVREGLKKAIQKREKKRVVKGLFEQEKKVIVAGGLDNFRKKILQNVVNYLNKQKAIYAGVDIVYSNSGVVKKFNFTGEHEIKIKENKIIFYISAKRIIKINKIKTIGKGKVIVNEKTLYGFEDIVKKKYEYYEYEVAFKEK